MAGDDLNVSGEILVKSCQLGRFAGRLATNDGSNFSRGSILCNDLINVLSLYTVDDPVTDPRYKVSVGKDVDASLTSSMMAEGVDDRQTSLANSALSDSYLSSWSHALILWRECSVS